MWSDAEGERIKSCKVEKVNPDEITRREIYIPFSSQLAIKMASKMQTTRAYNDIEGL